MNPRTSYYFTERPKTPEETYSDLKTKLDGVRSNQKRIKSMNLSAIIETATLAELEAQANEIKKKMHDIIDAF